jgi:hypothetical protein
MAKRKRDSTIIRPNKRPAPVNNIDPIEHKKHRQVEYWHQKPHDRREKAARIAEMYIHLLKKLK